MPRRLPLRPAKIIGNVFVFIVLSYISTVYYFYIFYLWGPRVKSNSSTYFISLNGGLSYCRVLPLPFIYAPLELSPGDVHWPRTGPRLLGIQFALNMLIRGSTKVTVKLRDVDIVWCVMCSNQSDAIIVPPAIDVCWIWTITVPGLTTALASGTESTSSYSSSMSSSPVTSLESPWSILYTIILKR